MPVGGHNPNLDILRSIAVLSVLATHVLQVIAGIQFGERVAFGVDTYALGRIGVLFFFVHTCLVLLQSLERTGAGLRPGEVFRNFYITRATRIYPLSIFLILIGVVFAIPPNALFVPYVWHGSGWFFENILLVQNINGMSDVSGPLWSLPYEVQMYVVLPGIYLWLKVFQSNFDCGLIFISGALLSRAHPLFYYFPCFLAGVIAYRLLGTVQPRLPAWLWGPVMIGITVLYTVTPRSDQSWVKSVFSCLTVGVLIPLFDARRSLIGTAASQIAKYSYGIYLSHMPLLWLIYRKLTLPEWSRPILVVLATAVVSLVCYHAIEYPLIRAGKRLVSERPVQRQETDLVPSC